MRAHARFYLDHLIRITQTTTNNMYQVATHISALSAEATGDWEGVLRDSIMNTIHVGGYIFDFIFSPLLLRRNVLIFFFMWWSEQSSIPKLNRKWYRTQWQRKIIASINFNTHSISPTVIFSNLFFFLPFIRCRCSFFWSHTEANRGNVVDFIDEYISQKLCSRNLPSHFADLNFAAAATADRNWCSLSTRKSNDTATCERILPPPLRQPAYWFHWYQCVCVDRRQLDGNYFWLIRLNALIKNFANHGEAKWRLTFRFTMGYPGSNFDSGGTVFRLIRIIWSRIFYFD